ncbi:MAG: acetamidase/formamidase family protein [Proteobacteria bacterium]|nr:acetamidase/formamidase family protein [Pseudomonadota bacterium]
MGQHHILRGDVGTVHRGTFDAAIKPVLSIASGDTVEVTTLSGNDENSPPPGSPFPLMPEHARVLAQVPRGIGAHLMTGPIAVEGAVPGDELTVEVLEIGFPQPWGWNMIKPGAGTLPADFPALRHIFTPIDAARGVVTMPWGLELKASPFFGVMGVAPRPADGACISNIPRAFGGNMDNKHFGVGATVHLPVFNDGGLLSVGDGHAVQGDGEVCVTAIETALRGTLRVTLVKRTGIGHPWAETPSHIITMGFDEDLDRAAEFALRAMIRKIGEVSGLSAEDAYSLCSVAADVHVTQLVNVAKGVHVMIAKELLKVG